MNRDDEVKNPRLFDVRAIERNIRKGLITRKDYDKHLKSLPDVTDKIAPRDAPPPAGAPMPRPVVEHITVIPPPPGSSLADDEIDALPDEDDDIEELDDDDLEDEDDDEPNGAGEEPPKA